MPRLASVCFLPLLLVLAPAAFADTLAVPQDFATIQAAVDAAVTGDTILISSGTYPGTVTLDGDSGLTLRAKGSVTIDATGLASGLVLLLCTDIRIERLRVLGGTSAGIFADQCPGLVLDGCRVSGTTGRGFDIDECDGAQLLRCRVKNVTSTGARLVNCADAVLSRWRIAGATDGLMLNVCDNALVEHCRLEDLTGQGLSLNSFFPGEVTNSIVTRNRIVGAQGGGIGLRGDGNLLERNLVLDGVGDGIELASGEQNDGNSLLCNRILRMDGMGLRASGTDNVLERNRGVDCTLDGINLQNGAYQVLLNRLVRPGDEGIEVNTPGCTLEENRVVEPGEDGLLLHALADGTTCLANQVTRAGMNGVSIECDDGTFTANVSKAAGADGFLLAGSNNALSLNRATGSAGFDLEDTSDGSNTVADDNHFGTTGP